MFQSIKFVKQGLKTIEIKIVILIKTFKIYFFGMDTDNVLIDWICEILPKNY